MLKVSEENAPKFLDWIANRGGVAVWDAHDFSGDSCSTPALTKDGQPMRKPHWKYPNSPSEIITDSSQVTVFVAKEIKRFHVGTRRGTQGFTFKVTDAGTARIRKELAKVPDSWYEFDYMDEKNCVIYTPDKEYPLSEFKQ